MSDRLRQMGDLLDDRPVRPAALLRLGAGMGDHEKIQRQPALGRVGLVQTDEQTVTVAAGVEHDAPERQPASLRPIGGGEQDEAVAAGAPLGNDVVGIMSIMAASRNIEDPGRVRRDGHGDPFDAGEGVQFFFAGVVVDLQQVVQAENGDAEVGQVANDLPGSSPPARIADSDTVAGGVRSSSLSA